MGVHNDFTCSYSESLARALELDDPSEARMATFGLLGQLKAAGVTGADLRTKYEVKVMGAWRNCSEHPLETMPLAMCDRRTVGTDELVDAEANIKGGVLSTVSAMPNDAHRWYWYPAMTNEEVFSSRRTTARTPAAAASSTQRSSHMGPSRSMGASVAKLVCCAWCPVARHIHLAAGMVKVSQSAVSLLHSTYNNNNNPAFL